MKGVIEMLDSFTARHLHNWLESHVHHTERTSVRTAILALLAEDPGLVDTHSWSEIRRLAGE